MVAVKLEQGILSDFGKIMSDRNLASSADGYDVQSLLDEMRAGSGDAFERFYRRFKRVVKREIRKKLNSKVRRIADSEDFCQSVMKSFFINDLNGEFNTESDVEKFLNIVTRGKVIDEIRKRLNTQAYNMNNDCQLEEAEFGDSGVSDTTTPSQIVSAQEQRHRLYDDTSERDRKIIELKEAGESNVSIAKIVGTCTKTVRRVIDKIELKIEH